MLEKCDIHITDHCNLNCRSCTHFAPLAPEFFLDVDDFARDIKRLSELTCAQLGQLFLLGGESLLHKELIDFFPVARNAFPETNIIIITNGIILLDMEPRFWKACKRYDIHIWVSKYDLSLDFSAMSERAKEYGVSLGFTSYTRTKDDEKYWGKWPIDPEGKQYYIDSFAHCNIRNCVALKEGKLYTCCTLANIEHFNRQFNTNLEISEYDYIDLYKIDSHEALLSAIVKPIPFCRYCKTREFQAGVWAPSKKDINEWI